MNSDERVGDTFCYLNERKDEEWKMLIIMYICFHIYERKTHIHSVILYKSSAMLYPGVDDDINHIRWLM